MDSMLNEGATFAAGEVVGGHQIVKLLGTGTFGNVYEARRLPIGRRVALKALHPRFATHAEVVQRFMREAEVVATLEHPNIVGVIDLGVHQQIPFITMQLLEGETLAARLARGPLSVTEALEHTLPMLSAVDTAHRHGVIHRDLKPENIFLEHLSTGRTETRLLDFGIAKIEEATLAMTGSSAMMGTPYYMPPEQVEGAVNVDARSDVWALGVILFEMVTGVKPFRGGNIAEIFKAITVDPTPSIRSVRGDLPVALDAVVARALAKRPEKRWASAAEFATALLPLAGPTLREPWAHAFGESLDGTLVESAVPVRSEVTQKLGTIGVAPGPGRGAIARTPDTSAVRVPAVEPPASTVFASAVRVPAVEPPASTVFASAVRAPAVEPPASTVFASSVRAPAVEPPASTVFASGVSTPTMMNSGTVVFPNASGTDMFAGGATPPPPALPPAIVGAAPSQALPAASASPRRSRKGLYLGVALAVVALGVVLVASLANPASDSVAPAPSVQVVTTVPGGAAPTSSMPAPAPPDPRTRSAAAAPGPGALPGIVPPAIADAGAVLRTNPAAARRPRRHRDDGIVPGLIDNF